MLAVSSFPRPLTDLFALPEKIKVFQHGGDWERSRPQGSKNVHTFLMTLRPLSWACGHGTEMLLILKKTIFDLIIPRHIQIWQSNLWLKPVPATGASSLLDAIMWNAVTSSETVLNWKSVKTRLCKTPSPILHCISQLGENKGSQGH